MNDITHLITTALATFGVAALLAGYDGPLEILVKLRSRVGVFRCVVCISAWLCLPITLLGATGYAGLINALAIIGLVIIAERLT